MTQGYIIVASNEPRFAYFAHQLALSILDFNPGAKIHLVTEVDYYFKLYQHFHYCNEIYDKVTYIPDNIGKYRAKIWGCAQSDYDTTCYIDADMVCRKSGLDIVFDALGENDMVWTYIREKNAADASWWDWRAGVKHPHGAFFVYRKNERMSLFFDNWYNHFYELHRTPSEKDWTETNYKWKQRHWDQVPLHAIMMNEQHRWYMPELKWDWVQVDKDWRFNWITPHYEMSYNYDPNEAFLEHYAKSSYRDILPELFCGGPQE
jgi:hypothetical protein